MSGRGLTNKSARLLCAAAIGFGCGSAGLAQQPAPDSAELDPSAPLDPLPDLGVEWPDITTPDPVAAPADATQERTTKIDSAVGDRRYTVTVEGVEGISDGENVLASFRRQSALEGDRKRGSNVAQISRRAQADSDLLAELLRSRGFYDATVEPRIDGSGDSLQVVIAAEPGDQYRFATVELPGLEAAGAEDVAALSEAFAVKAGDPVIAENVIAGGAELKRKLGEEGFASAKIGDQDIVINHETRLATLVLPVDTGPVAQFGAITVDGTPPFSARHVGVIARFRRGDQFRRSRIDDLRRALIATGLVSNATVTAVPVDGGKTVDVLVKLEPAPSHTIAGEIGYGTGQGVRLEGSWTDRNFYNPEGALTVRGVAGTQEQVAAVQFRRSNFERRDQVLNLQALASNQKFDAYEARTIKLGANIERQSNFIWHKKWTFTAGAEILATDERGAFDVSGTKDKRTFFIAALPGGLGYDGSDSLLDPTNGFRLSGWLSPEISAHGGQFTYARTQIDASTYRRVSERVVAAGRIRLGTIVGAGVYDIAPSRRFYSGGGGSVRGYGYQRLGPKDVDGDPVGGRGLAEFSLEARIRLARFGGNFGVVPFVDAGALSRGLVPRIKDLRYAVGLGLRYYSSFGPIRIDVGVPLNREKGDGPVAVSVSLGQAF
ncbi:MAG: BamA/TamA family outer membrane protein [Sphingomicrobium sp.]